MTQILAGRSVWAERHRAALGFRMAISWAAGGSDERREYQTRWTRLCRGDPQRGLPDGCMRSIRFEAHHPEEGEQDGARSAPAGSLAVRPRGVGNGTHRPPPSPPLPPQGGASKRLSDPNSLLRDPSRRVVRVEIGHKPGVFRGTGGSNPVSSSSASSELPYCRCKKRRSDGQSRYHGGKNLGVEAGSTASSGR